MIRVQRQPEYAEFDREVRQKGVNFLASCPRPNSYQFNRHSYWRKALYQLHAVYNGRCAYTSRELVDSGSVDHFKPKSKYPRLAYEWGNYRFSRQEINNRKSDSEDIADPFAIHNGWFILDMPSCLIKPGLNVTKDVRRTVNATINILRLNDDDGLVEERLKLLLDLADGAITLEYLDHHYPFLSVEVRRQNVFEELGEIFARL